MGVMGALAPTFFESEGTNTNVFLRQSVLDGVWENCKIRGRMKKSSSTHGF